MRIKLDIPLTLDEIRKAIGADECGGTIENIHIDTVCTDTRECQSGDLFIALVGENDSGDKYVANALKMRCFVLSSLNTNGTLRVKDTADALLKISKLYKSKLPSLRTVAVTGSVGKSTTVQFIYTILSTKYKVHRPCGNYNNHIGVPLTILSMPRDTEILVLEFGMNHRKEISRLSVSSEPDIGIINTIGTAHIGNLGSREEIATAKLEILDGMKEGALLLPCDEPLLSNKEYGLYVGRNSSLSDFALNDSKNGSYSFKSKDRDINDIEFFDNREHILYDLAFAIATSKMLGLSNQEILKGVKAITTANLRQRFIVLKDFTIFDDSYNASLESVSADLKYISSLNKPTGAFLGDILELGDNTAFIHERIGEIAANLRIDHLYLYGKYSKYTALGAINAGMDASRIYINTDISSPEKSIRHIKEHHHTGEIILFKASHRLRLDKIADKLENEERNDNE